MFERTMAVLALALLAGLLPLLLVGEEASGATTLPAGFKQSQVTAGLVRPTAMAFAPDGRLFVAEQGGKLRVIKGGKLLSAPFVDMRGVTDSTGERGLLGIAFDPNFATNRYIYVYHTLRATSTSPARNRIFRFTANGDVFVPGSGRTVLELDGLSAKTNHNGGAIHFGRDGKLYAAVGENATKENAQSLSNLHGKMLRINADGTIPADNPFYDRASGKNRAIWALGLRNPYSFAVQPGTGRMLINDVGQDRFEEINSGVSGANYGWANYEGPESDPLYQGPLYWYGHGNTTSTGCAVTGGAFYNPRIVRFPGTYVGDYFFADICSGWIKRLDYDPASGGFVRVLHFASGLIAPVDLQVNDGSLYYLSRGDGSVNVIRYAP